ncbi:unnamed protein product [Effrenium voratum]|uniref:Uncharacterized protein n=1 Tax=Effrenium voratum TaxID=2562239 RepID=A0AA36I420_9DINO|nr:unnamed protein product [Effrenium voratum]
MGNAGAQAASICCHVERLPRQLNVAAAPASGPKPGVQSDQGFYECYEELDTGGELDASTWVHTKGVRTQDVKGVHTKLLYSCLHIQKTISPLKDHELEKHLKVLCSISHPHLCKVVECFDAGDERLLISEKPFEDRLVTSFAGSPWTREKEPSLEPSQMRKDEKVIAEMLRQVLSALAHGHARGCIHGMLTPDKFRIGSSKSRASRIPQVKILGFGLGYALVPPLGFFIQKELSKDRNMTGKREGVPYTAAESLISKDQFLERLRNCLQSQGEPLMSSEVSKATPRLAVQADGPAEEARPRTQADLHLIDGHLRGLAPEGADKADIWAVGALAYRLLTGVPPFLPSREGAKKDLKQAEPIKFSKSDWESRSSKCLDAVRCMLRVTSSLRPSAAEMLRHPWLKLAREPVPLVRMHRLFANSLNFLKESQFKKLIIRVIAEQMPEVDSHLEQANSVFRALDRDRDALLSPAEFMQGLHLFPDLVKRLGEDPESLFEAADRDGSGYLDSREFAACTLPPATSRDEEVVWHAFRAFDGTDQVVTIEKVLFIAKHLEGLAAQEQLQELLSVLQAELLRLRVPLKPEAEEAAESEAESDVSERLQAEGEGDENDEDEGQDEEPGVAPATTSFSSSRQGKEKGKGSWLHRRWQAWVEKTRRWVTRPRSLDYGEFLYLCDTRRKGVGPGRLMYRVARKEVFRILLKHNLDFYEVVHKVGDLTFPQAGEPARTAASCYYATGGLCSKQQQLRQEEQKKQKKKTQAEDGQSEEGSDDD